MVCIAPGKGPPQCPPTFCDPTYGQCSCCWSNTWAADPLDPSLPPLCEPGFDPLLNPEQHLQNDPEVSAGSTAPGA